MDWYLYLRAAAAASTVAPTGSEAPFFAENALRAITREATMNRPRPAVTTGELVVWV